MMTRLPSVPRHIFACLLLALLAPLALAAHAPRKLAAHKQQLAFVLILARHGVRAPSAPAAVLDRYSIHPWPAWPVAPDDLTPHGYKLLRQFGEWDRAWLARQNLLTPSGCAAPAIYIYTDSDERTIQSGHALAEGLSPACTVTIHSRPQGQRDPLFHFSPGSLDAATRAAMLASVRERMGGSPNTFTAAHQSELNLLQSVLDGCKPGAPCTTPPGQPSLRLDEIRSSVKIKSQGDVSLHGPVFTGASLAEDILLEYTQGVPRNNVAWGLLHPSQLREIVALHTAEFAAKHRNPVLARVEMSNLLSHILDTLQQAVQARAVPGAWGTPAQKLVVLDGHDTDIAAIAGLLRLHWTLDGRHDDTPPGTQLQFLVYRDARGAASIKMRIVMQTLRQMRQAAALTALHPPASATLNLAGCTMNVCSWHAFDAAARSAIDPRFILPFSQP
ncbi:MULTISPECIES: histidine-type phosphatase [Acidobacterium]|uniref:Histidine acid phosphatase family protein n=1 Tax=Acidobacterium capsulatum (strain ATCC 51196 / DSM 11244 / BCRC 80197 / JCM 7670 / NBRC 15755 / NCIMB 13165 / 161) TaxID=240015 RepID=C1F6S1_ACIC5|nr:MULTISPECIES: histidine-type phosphatase [Acidobacterium]ACO33689.1 histidine acid phosphatase family protein [Acidobacterium capsulatum ATCC 51196]HCT60962.1 histidine-type phosphatase [Acidobacterium sp.]